LPCPATSARARDRTSRLNAPAALVGLCCDVAPPPPPLQEELDASFTSIAEQLLLALQRQQASGPETCLRLLSCAGLGWGLHRLLSNQSLLEIGRRSASYKPVLALLSFLARSDHRSPEGKHLYASLLVTPLRPKGWVCVHPPAESETSGASKPGALDAPCPPRRSQRAKGPAAGMQRAPGSDGALEEVDLASMDTVASLLASLKTQASMFVSLAKSGASATGASSSSSKAKASGGKLDAAKLQRGDTHL
jgi:hypothetical protein